MAIFYEGPYIVKGAGVSEEHVIGTLDTTDKATLIKVAKMLSLGGRGRGRGITVVASIPEKNITVMASKGKLIKIPDIMKEPKGRAARAAAEPDDADDE
jgi:hypothetical protein